MSATRLRKVISLCAMLTIMLFHPILAHAQSTVDLVVHYVEGAPAEGQIAYEVSVYLSVVDSAGNPIKDLTAENFTVTEDSQKVEIGSIELAKDEPINIVLLLDTSGSMSGAGIGAAKTAASNFVAGLEAGDRVAILTFDDSVRARIDFTTDHRAARDQIALIDAVRGAGTCLYDAAYQAVQMTATVPSGRRAVVLFTDGVDEKPGGGTCSTHTLDDVIDLASEGGTRTPVYTLGMGTRVDDNTLKRLAELTGGRYLYSPDTSQLDAMFLRLSDSLRSQYLLRYTSVAGPGAHTLAVSVTYSSATDSDTRNFLLPAMPPRASFTSPLEGDEVSETLHLAVSVSGQGETIDRLAFEINGEVVDTDETAPYETDVDLSPYQPGNLTITAVVYGANNVELTRTSTTVTLLEAPPVVEEPPRTATNTVLAIGGGVLGLIVVAGGVVAFYVIRQRRQERARDEAWAKAQSYEEAPVSVAEDRTYDSWEPSPDALGMLTVIQSDDPAMVGQRFEVLKSPTTLGRSADNDINFPKDSPVSRHHATIEEKKGGLFLSQVGSVDSSGQTKLPTYGTFVNEIETGTDPVLLQSGDEIRLGKRVRLRFEASARISSSEEKTYDGLETHEVDPEKTRDQ